MIIRLNEGHIDEMLALQAKCIDNSDIFLPTSREGYLRAFCFDNFCFGFIEGGEMLAFLNASIPTVRGGNNLGRGRLPEDQLDRVGQMNTLLVKGNCRHHGIGRELVKAVLEEFAARDCPHIFVTASPRNAASLKLLDTEGFQILDILCLCGRQRCLLYRRLPSAA